MFIMMVSAELAPVAKVGGLADVVFGLSRELEVRGHAVEIILPKYDCM
jgi:starch synthase